MSGVTGLVFGPLEGVEQEEAEGIVDYSMRVHYKCREEGRDEVAVGPKTSSPQEQGGDLRRGRRMTRKMSVGIGGGWVEANRGILRLE